jgi:hypothetical protein
LMLDVFALLMMFSFVDLVSYTSIISKSAFATPQSGHAQSFGMSAHAVPGLMPSSGSPTFSL